MTPPNEHSQDRITVNHITPDALFAQVRFMHRKFGIEYENIPRHLSDEEKKFRLTALREEVQEYEDAKTLEDELDALIDVIVFALGAIERHGFVKFNVAFQAVMAANCRKKVGPNKKRNDYQFDLVKPEGWWPADMTKFLKPTEAQLEVFVGEGGLG